MRAEYYCVRGRGGIWSVTLRQRRAELGSFKLDLDSPGDTPHRISPLGQTWTRRSSLTLAWLDRQKMGEHFPNGTGMRPHFTLTPPQLNFSSPPTQPNYLLPISPSWLKIAWGGARRQEKGRSRGAAGGGYDLFVYVGELSELVATPLYCCTRVNIG